MAQTSYPRHKIEMTSRNKVTYIERSTLFGLVKWWEKARSDRIGNDLIIETDPAFKIGEIYLNGEKINEIICYLQARDNQK